MIGFRIAALALPAASAFLAPALWTWRPGWKAATLGHAALLAVVIVCGVLAGAPRPALLAASVLSTAFAFFALGLHLAAGQVVSGLAVVLLCSTLFLAPSVIDDAVSRGRRRDLEWTTCFFNPWASLAARPFERDLLREPGGAMYRTGVADYVSARPPSWGGMAAGYAAGGLLLAAAAVGVRRLRRPPHPQSPA
jgi:hypothetical protein